VVDDSNITNNNNSNTLFVGNLPFSIGEKDLYELFGGYGKIVGIKTNVDEYNGKSLRFAFVEFEGREDPEMVFTKFNNYELNGRKLRLDCKKSNEESLFHRLHKRDHFKDREIAIKSNISENKRYTPYDNRVNIKRRDPKNRTHSTFDKIKYLYNQGRVDQALHEYFKNPNSFIASFLIKREDNMKLALNIYKAAKESSTCDLLVIITFMKVLERRNENHLINPLWDDVMTTIEKMSAREISKINVVTWNALITGLCKKRRVNNALKLLDIMHQNNMRFDSRNYACLLAKCNNKECLKFGKRIHDYLIENNELNTILKNFLINMYAKGGALEEALNIFKSMTENISLFI
jgi:pentatricopeptide repeat protein